MNRITKEYLSGGKNTPALSHHHRRGRSLIGGGNGGGGGGGGLSRNTDENLDLFSRNRPTLEDADADAAAGSASSNEPDVSMKLGRLSVGSAKVARSGMDDLLSSVEGGKHDYDWLLTPPGTPLFSSSDASEPQPTSAGPRKSSSVRSVSTTKSSRLSITQSENGHSSRPTRSTSVTRPSVSSVNYNTYSSNRSSSVLNTSSGSVTSISRPSTPGACGSVSSNTRPSTPSGRSMPSRPLTPAKSRPTTTTSAGEKTRASQVSRPSTPTSRPQIHANLNSPVARSNSRPSTPTRRNPASGPPAVIGRSASVGRALTSGRNMVLASRGSSPGPRTRSTQQPIVPLDFPLDTPPNLRTSLPDRPISTGRSRPNVAPAVRGIPDSPGPINQPRRQSSSPIVTRGRHPELSAKGRLHASGHNISAADNQKATPVSDPAIRRSSKPATAIESTGFGRTISKKSLDMALRHMDIRQGSGGVRPLSGTTLFPQSVRSGTAKGQRARVWDPPPPPSMNTNCIGRPPVHGGNATYAENGNCIDGSRDAETEEEVGRLSAKVNVPDIYESSRYDTILLKEDLKNTNWLHSIDDKSDMGLLFDHRFEPLPEPFDPL